VAASAGKWKETVSPPFLKDEVDEQMNAGAAAIKIRFTWQYISEKFYYVRCA
jgi:hypothetical protein